MPKNLKKTLNTITIIGIPYNENVVAFLSRYVGRNKKL